MGVEGLRGGASRPTNRRASAAAVRQRDSSARTAAARDEAKREEVGAAGEQER